MTKGRKTRDRIPKSESDKRYIHKSQNDKSFNAKKYNDKKVGSFKAKWLFDLNIYFSSLTPLKQFIRHRYS